MLQCDVKLTKKVGLYQSIIQSLSNLSNLSCLGSDQDAVPYTIEVDAIAICTGTNTFSSLPNFPGQDNFKGQIIHSEFYQHPEVFKDKRVMIVGSGYVFLLIC